MADDSLKGLLDQFNRVILGMGDELKKQNDAQTSDWDEQQKNAPMYYGILPIDPAFDPQLFSHAPAYNSEDPSAFFRWMDEFEAKYSKTPLPGIDFFMVEPEEALAIERDRERQKAFQEEMAKPLPPEEVAAWEEVGRTLEREETIKKSDSEVSAASSKKDFKVQALVVKGDVEVLLPTEKDWRPLKQDDVLPEGTKIFTSMDSTLLINIDGIVAAKVLAFSELTLTKNSYEEARKPGSNSPIIFDLDLQAGEVEVRVDKSTYQVSGQVSTPQSVTPVRGTHFWVSYLKKSKVSITGVYDGKVEVTKVGTDKKYVLTSTKAGPRIAFVFTGQHVQPKSNKPTQTPVSQERPTPQTNRNVVLPLLILISAGGIGLFILHKKGKLIPLYKKYRGKMSGTIKVREKIEEEKT